MLISARDMLRSAASSARDMLRYVSSSAWDMLRCVRLLQAPGICCGLIHQSLVRWFEVSQVAVAFASNCESFAELMSDPSWTVVSGSGNEVLSNPAGIGRSVEGADG